MISIEKCQKILGKQNFTKEEVKLIREYLYQFSEIIINSLNHK